MFVLRLLVVLALIAVAVSMGIYLLSGDKRYLRFSWQIVKFTLVLLLISALVFITGRVILR